MFSWLRSFFYSDDPEIKLADGLSEFDAAQYQELLEHSGIFAMQKAMDGLHGREWRPMLINNFALYVKQSDVEAAYEILGHLIDPYETAQAREVHERIRKQQEAG